MASHRPPRAGRRRTTGSPPATYTGQIMTVARELGLERPVVMGCSIGGRIVLDLALKHARELRALIGLQSAAYVERYYESGWLNHAEVHGGQACGAIAYGLMSPLSPDAHRWETVWHYMQGGPGVFTGDLFFYQVEGDIRERIGAIDTGVCPLYMLTGEYDYSASPAGHRSRGGTHQRRESDDHEGARPLPDEREPGRVSRLPAAGAGRDSSDGSMIRAFRFHPVRRPIEGFRQPSLEPACPGGSPRYVAPRCRPWPGRPARSRQQLHAARRPRRRHRRRSGRRD